MMPNDQRPPLSEAETEVLKALWEHGPGTVRELRSVLDQRGIDWAHTTVITLLGRLEKKGYAQVDKAGFAHMFTAAVSRDELLRQRLAELATDLCDGTPAPLLLALARQHRFTAAELAELRQMLDRIEAKRRPRPSTD